jgi:hypothetical protein
VQLKHGNKKQCKMTCIPVSIWVLFLVPRYPCVVQGWKGLHVYVPMVFWAGRDKIAVVAACGQRGAIYWIFSGCYLCLHCNLSDVSTHSGCLST